MSEKLAELIALSREIARRPQMFARTPQIAHGLLEALGWMIFSEVSGKRLEVAFLDVADLLRIATKDLGLPEHAPALLCGPPQSEQAADFTPFRARAAIFVDLLQEEAAGRPVRRLPSVRDPHGRQNRPPLP